jgi:hypothetical protein
MEIRIQVISLSSSSRAPSVIRPRVLRSRTDHMSSGMISVLARTP